MPKVTEEYKQEKRKMIVRAALEILEQKPLYELNMLEVIKQAKLSKGGIYLYFADIDELLIEVMNTVFSEQEDISFSEEYLEGNVEDSLVNIFRQLGEYIEACPPIVGKIRYELSIYLTNNPQKMEIILPRLKPQQTGARFMALVEALLHKGIEQKIFCGELKLDVIMTNISVYIDGMTEYVVRMRVYGGPKLCCPVSTYFEQFIRSEISQWKEECSY